MWCVTCEWAVSSCSTCGDEIVWLQKPNGQGWHRPLEPDYSGVSIEGVAVLVEDGPRIVDTRQLRIYREHVCSAVRSGVAPPPHRTATFEELAERKRAEEQEEMERELGKEQARRVAYTRQYRDNKGYQRTGTLREGTVLDVSCPECGSQPGMICFSPKQGWPKTEPHNERKWLVVEKGPSPGNRRKAILSRGYEIRPPLGESDEHPFPMDPEDALTTAMHAMRDWLRVNRGLFDNIELADVVASDQPEPIESQDVMGGASASRSM